jgi:hypothetical protein
MSAFVPLLGPESLRICLSHSDAAQWWPGIWGWTGPVGHGLDTMGQGGGQESQDKGGNGGIPAAPYMRMDFTNLFQNLW